LTRKPTFAIRKVHNSVQLNVPGVIETVITGINNKGEIVGNYWTETGGAVKGFVYDGSIFTSIEPPGLESMYLTDINDSGQIVGFGNEPDGENIEFIYSKSKITAL
jgi:hypothetical protein